MKQIPHLTHADVERFWTGVDTSGVCWLWKRSCFASGYGLFSIGGRNFRAHRVAYVIAHSTDPEGLCVLHRCDNPQCVNPNHLFLGTNIDNVRDRTIKGRSATGERSGARLHPESRARGARHPFRINPELHVRGERAGRARLNETQVREIRRLHRETGIGKLKLAKQFGVSKPAITDIIRGRRWKHVK